MTRYKKTEQLLDVFIVTQLMVRGRKFEVRKEKYHKYYIEVVASTGKKYPYMEIMFGSTQVWLRTGIHYSGSKTIPMNKKYNYKKVGKRILDEALYCFESFEDFEKAFKTYLL